MKVFIVFEGEYSDRRPVGVFSSEEKAAELGLDDIEEFELDAITDKRWMLMYGAVIRLADGEVIRRGRRGPGMTPAGFRGEAKISHETAWALSVESEDHALKLAVEKRQEWLRAREDAR